MVAVEKGNQGPDPSTRGLASQWQTRLLSAALRRERRKQRLVKPVKLASSHHLNPCRAVHLVRLSPPPTRQSPARSRPHSPPPVLHFQPATDKRVATRPLRCPIVRPQPSLFSHPAPAAPAQPKSLLAGAENWIGGLDASLDSASAHPPEAQNRYKFIRCHERLYYRKIRGVGGMMLRYDESQSCRYFAPRPGRLAAGVPPGQRARGRVPASSHGPDRYEVPASSFPPSLSHLRCLSAFFALQSHSLSPFLSLSPFSPLPSGPAEKERRNNRVQNPISPLEKPTSSSP